MKNPPNKEQQRLETTINEKLRKGWNCFTREEMEAVIALLHQSRRAKTALQQRVHTAHGDAVAWHLDGDVGLHERRPAPEGARNLFEKPPRLDFVRGWRVPVGVKVRGWKVTEDGRLVQHRNRTPQSPNDLMRHLHQTLNNLSYAYKVYENDSSNEAGNSGGTGPAAEPENLPGGSGEPAANPLLPEQSSTDREDLPGDGEE